MAFSLISPQLVGYLWGTCGVSVLLLFGNCQIRLHAPFFCWMNMQVTIAQYYPSIAKQEIAEKALQIDGRIVYALGYMMVASTFTMFDDTRSASSLSASSLSCAVFVI